MRPCPNCGELVSDSSGACLGCATDISSRHAASTEPVGASDELTAGCELGGFVIDGLLARGGMGVIYRALDETLSRRVALKVISPALAADHGFRARFRRESRLAAQVEHRSVVPIYRAGQDGGRLYIAMRLIDGTDLSEELNQRGRLPAAEAVRIIGEVAAALDAAHARGLVHRDIKPANVLIAATDRQAFLTDFGLTIDRNTRSTLTHSGHWIGTPAYAAPEQLRGGAIDPRTDVYALGGVLFHCLTGQLPYPAVNELDALSAHLLDPPPRPTSVNPQLPPAFDAVVEQAMAKVPAARFASAGEFAMAAQAATVGAADATTEAVTRSLRPHPPPPGRPPLSATPLVGRNADVAHVTATLREGEVRLVTLTGPGGIGKTRLALEVARGLVREFADGVCFVDLSRVQGAESVQPAIAEALGVRSAGDATVDDALAVSLADRQQLLLLDNFEHVIEAAERIPRLLATAPALKVLVTSRAPVRLLAEHEYRVPPLPKDDAVVLFEMRARAIRPQSLVDSSDAGAIVEVCARLEGVPLAIELAAARLRHLTPQSLLQRLAPCLQILTDGPRDLPDRQRTLRATIKWSHDLLGEDERRLFARLAVFVGGFTIEDAEAVCETELDTLTALVDNSLLLWEDRVLQQPRFRLLETIREYATEQLDTRDDQASTRDRHAKHYVKLAEQAEPELWGGPRQRDWLERLRVEDGNLRAALERLEHNGPVEHHLRLTAALWRLWLLHGRWTEGAHRVEAALTHSELASPEQRWRLLLAAAVFASRLRDVDQSAARAEELEAFGRECDDQRVAGYAAVALAHAHREAGHFADARASDQLALNIGQESNDKWLIRISTTNLADAALTAGDYATAETLARQGAALSGDQYDEWTLGLSIANLTLALLLQDCGERAAPLLVEGLLLSERLELREITSCYLERVAALTAKNEPELASELLGAAEALNDDLGALRDPAEERLYEDTLTTVAALIAPESISAARQAGRRMSSHQAVAQALDALQS